MPVAKRRRPRAARPASSPHFNPAPEFHPSLPCRLLLTPVAVELRRVSLAEGLSAAQEPVVQPPRSSRSLMRDQKLLHQPLQLGFIQRDVVDTPPADNRGV